MLILVTLIPAFPAFIQSLTPGDVGHQVANTHTIFAILAVALEFPFANVIVRLSEKVVPILPEESRSMEDRKLKYTGLGLAIVKHIAELHDARILVDSQPGKGTCITVQM